MKKCLFILAILSVSIFGRGQSNFIKAVVINNSGDSIFGNIDYRNWKINPQTISFVTLANERQTFDASSIRGFYVPTVNESYTSFSVHIDMIPGTEDRALNSGLIDSLTLHKRVFLLQLVKHPALSLYEFTDNNKEHFYYKKGNEEPVELIHHYLYDETRKQVSENLTYKKQLTVLLETCPGAVAKLKTLKFRKKDIQDIIVGYLQCNSPGSVADIKKDDPGSLEFGIVAGLTLNKFIFKGEYHPMGGENYDDDLSPVVGVSLDFGLPRNRNKWHIINELIYKSYNTGTSFIRYTGNGYVDTGDVKISFSYLQLNTIVRYIFPSNASLKPFISLGMGNAYMIAEKENNIHTKSSFANQEKNAKAIDHPDKYEFSLLGGVGLAVRSIHMEFRYANGIKSFSPYSTLIVKPKSFQIIGTYQF